jgi:N-acetylmuramoyl-L-alanine amidase
VRQWRNLLVVTWALVVCAGCRHAPKGPAPITPLYQLPAARLAATPPSAPTPGAVAVAATPPAATSAAAPPKVGPEAVSVEATKDGWVSLARWAGANGLGELAAEADGSNLRYKLPGAGGGLVIGIGKRQARWGGLELWLGFPPRLLNDEPQVHRLDVEKNLAPLLASQQAGPLTNRVIVLDPGHGGDDSGAKSAVADRYEKEFTLDWARRLKPLLEAQGWEVCLTRTNDTDLSLAERIAVAEARQAALFISLHFNSSGANGELEGLETYCLTPTGMPSSVLRTAADDLGQTYPNNAFDAQNVRWAMRLHRALVERTAEPDRGLRRARFMGVLRGQHRPAMLLEGGYLSHPREALLIASPEYRQQLAEAVAQALKPE